MTSKELKKRLYPTPNRHNLYCFLELEVEELIKDLELLEIFKSHLYHCNTEDLFNGVISEENYSITIFKDLHEKDFNIIKERLENDK